MKKTLSSLTLAAMAFFILPVAARAGTITLDSVTPELVEDITAPDNAKEGEENFYTFWFIDNEGEEYQVVFNVSEQPAMVFVSGGTMTLDSNWTYDEEAGQITVNYTAVQIEQISQNSEKSWEDDQTLTVIAVSFPVAEGENGPGESMIGSWIATPFQEWTLITPTENSNKMGARVQGDAGASGSFAMFIPDTAVTTIGENDGAEEGEFDENNMGIFEDDSQVSGDIESVEGGAFVSFTTTLPEETSDGGDQSCEEGVPPEDCEEGDQQAQTFTVQEGPGVAQNVVVKPRLPINMVVSDTSVKKGKKITINGWIKSGKKGQDIRLFRKPVKKNKKTKFTVFKNKKTTAGGKFRFTVKVKKKMKLRAQFKKQKSDAVTISVN